MITAEQIIEEQKQIICQQEEQISKLNEELSVLKHAVSLFSTKMEELQAENEKLKKTSRNSNKPPSKDNDFKKPVVKNQRIKSKLKPGGQPGREGKTRTYAEEPDKIVELKPTQGICDECGEVLIIESEACKIRQIIEAEKPRTVVIEYQQYKGVCGACEKVFVPELPAGAKGAMSIGDTLKAYVIYLTQYQLLPLNRTVQLINDIYGVKLSEGTLVNIQNEYAEFLEPFVERAKEILINSPVVNFDETGMPVNGALWWMHVASKTDLTLYEIITKRGQEGMDAMAILPLFTGVAVHDHLKSYYHYTLCAHAECNAHILRYLIFLHEDCGYIWAGLMIGLLLKIKKHVDLTKIFGSEKLETSDINQYEHDYQMILEAAVTEEERTGDIHTVSQTTESRRMRTRLEKYAIETLTFMYDFMVPFDNNLAERDIRMPKAKKKISGGFRSVAGSKAFAIARSFISTCTKRGLSVFDGLNAVLLGNAFSFLGSDFEPQMP
jgi:transposase